MVLVSHEEQKLKALLRIEALLVLILKCLQEDEKNEEKDKIIDVLTKKVAENIVPTHEDYEFKVDSSLIYEKEEEEDDDYIDLELMNKITKK